ncbi:hypothetical protein JTE90_010634 [Oedothorax gibbosus]|uniref:Uncharacterized protein n=1 Tax=Oedothorax gibbosus TaxID=931172 RepID=A0AAV6VI45_9ARAC|nr:hypothetical protein JTE90_010634 [Oedothorax gibbosus]
MPIPPDVLCPGFPFVMGPVNGIGFKPPPLRLWAPQLGGGEAPVGPKKKNQAQGTAVAAKEQKHRISPSSQIERWRQMRGIQARSDAVIGRKVEKASQRLGEMFSRVVVVYG